MIMMVMMMIMVVMRIERICDNINKSRTKVNMVMIM